MISEKEANLIGQDLELISGEIVIVPEYMIVGWSRSSLFKIIFSNFFFELFSYLDTSVRAKIEIELCWMTDSNIDSSTSRDVSRLANLVVFVLAEQSKTTHVHRL